jgi:hypothetical protein
LVRHEAETLRERCRERYVGWNMRHFFGCCPSESDQRSYAWVKQQL